MVPKMFRSLIALLMLGSALFVLAHTAVAAETSVVGIVTDDGAIQTDDGEFIEVADTEAGNEMLEFSGQRVEAKGEVTEVDGIKTIVVKSYILIE